jgi:hypothetical protein
MTLSLSFALREWWRMAPGIPDVAPSYIAEYDPRAKIHHESVLNHEFAQCYKYVLGATGFFVESHAVRTPLGLSPVVGGQLRRVEHEDFVPDLDHKPRVAAVRLVPDRPVALAVGPVRKLDGGGGFDGEGVKAFQFDPAGERAVVGAGRR